MDEDEIDRLVVRVRADTTGFARDVEAMRDELEGPLEMGAERAGRAVESALLKAVRSGKLGFEELKAVALQILSEIAAAAVREGLDVVFGRSGKGGTSGPDYGPDYGMSAALAGLVGAPGRATGGPVSPGRPYWVGERGPELFVPASAGSVAAPVTAGPREIRVSITVNAPVGEAPRALAQSSRQVARAVKAALAGVE
ncbi:MAG: tail tape measure protein [Sphingomonas sp.]|uniref:tail tape measure protein n=1 Tax=Sphingomonas sp. TaxID=28214 RepID=UPI001B1AA426|nr:tail tape measure protein [Sphingomonas sp.]MBO9622136.1 tail tape measure protein [Sphingomonas sp.]